MIVTYFGRIGEGKTLGVTRDIIRELNRGRVVFANYPINWFGRFIDINWFQKQFNKIYSNKWHRNKTLKDLDSLRDFEKRLDERIRYLNDNLDSMGVPVNPDGLRTDITKYWAKLYNTRATIKDLENVLDRIDRGYFQPVYYPASNLSYFEQFSEILDKRNCLIAIDEAHNVLASKNWAKIPAEFTRQITMSRHLGVDMLLISQRPMAIVNDVRANSAYMWRAKKIGPSFLGIFAKYKYFAENESAIPNFDTEKPAGRDFYLGKKWFKYYNTHQNRLIKIEEYMK